MKTKYDGMRYFSDSTTERGYVKIFVPENLLSTIADFYKTKDTMLQLKILAKLAAVNTNLSLRVINNILLNHNLALKVSTIIRR